jgi:hypothetical protein
MPTVDWLDMKGALVWSCLLVTGAVRLGFLVRRGGRAVLELAGAPGQDDFFENGLGRGPGRDGNKGSGGAQQRAARRKCTYT